MQDFDECLDASLRGLAGWYDEASGLFTTTGWWNNGNALTTLSLYAIGVHSGKITGRAASSLVTPDWVLNVLNNTFHRYRNTTYFLNGYYDDEGWWALCFVAAHELAALVRGRDDELAAAFLGQALFLSADIGASWNSSECGGGVWWNRDRTYKNAIANELYMQLTARLARSAALPSAIAMDAAGSVSGELEWFLASGMMNESTWTINDGLTARCVNNGMTAWSYNQGVILGALSVLASNSTNGVLPVNAAEVRARLTLADRIARGATAALANNADGVFVEPCEPHCGADGPQFKGVLLRNMAYLAATLRTHATFNTSAAMLRATIERNAMSICQRAVCVRRANGTMHTTAFIGLQWRGPFDKADAARQSSGLDALVAYALTRLT